MSWEGWRPFFNALDGVETEKSGFFSLEGALCIGGSAVEVSVPELLDLVKSIKSGDASQSKSIGGKKYMIVGVIDNGIATLKAGNSGYCVAVGSKYVVLCCAQQGVQLGRVNKSSASACEALHK